MRSRQTVWIARMTVVLFLAIVIGVGAAEKTEVSLLWWLNEGRGEEYVNNLDIIHKFEELFPNITVDLVFADWGEITDKTKVLAATGSAPDVMWLRGDHYWDLATSGLLAELSPHMSKDPKWNPANFLPGVLESCQVEGGIYALHRDVYPPTLHYNVDMFEEAGIADPAPGWTFEELRSIAKRLTNPEKRKFGFGNIQDARESIILSYGGSFMNPSQTEFELSTPESLAHRPPNGIGQSDQMR